MYAPTGSPCECNAEKNYSSFHFAGGLGVQHPNGNFYLLTNRRVHFMVGGRYIFNKTKKINQ